MTDWIQYNQTVRHSLYSYCVYGMLSFFQQCGLSTISDLGALVPQISLRLVPTDDYFSSEKNLRPVPEIGAPNFRKAQWH